LELQTDPGFGHVGGGSGGNGTGGDDLLIMPKAYAEGLDQALSSSLEPRLSDAQRQESPGAKTQLPI
jgi:hypothetical protein